MPLQKQRSGRFFRVDGYEEPGRIVSANDEVVGKSRRIWPHLQAVCLSAFLALNQTPAPILQLNEEPPVFLGWKLNEARQLVFKFSNAYLLVFHGPETQPQLIMLLREAVISN